MHNRKKKKEKKEKFIMISDRDKRKQIENLTRDFLKVKLTCNARNMHCKFFNMSFISLMTINAFNNVRINIKSSHMNIS